MLTDAQIERYGRQILLPEIGGRGQERLLDAGVSVVGTGRAADVAVWLLARAGIHRLHLDGPVRPDGLLPPASARTATDDVRVMVDADPSAPRLNAAVIAVSTAGYVAGLRGRPCASCFTEPTGGLEASTLTPAIRWQLGSLAAAEVIRLLVTPTSTARLHRLEPTITGLATMPIPETAGCAECPPRA